MPEMSSFMGPVFDEQEPLDTNTLKRTPVVHSTIDEFLPPLPSSRILYPTLSPIPSPLSLAILSDTEVAEIRRGWVQTILHTSPLLHI